MAGKRRNGPSWFQQTPTSVSFELTGLEQSSAMRQRGWRWRTLLGKIQTKIFGFCWWCTVCGCMMAHQRIELHAGPQRAQPDPLVLPVEPLRQVSVVVVATDKIGVRSKKCCHKMAAKRCVNPLLLILEPTWKSTEEL